MVLDSEGKTVCAFSDENGGSLSQYSADKIGAITYSTASDGTSKNVFKVLDPATKAWGEELPLPNNAWNCLLYTSCLRRRATGMRRCSV